MYTYTQNRILHHEDCPARSLYPWNRSEAKLTIKGMALRMVNEVLSCDPDLTMYLLTNQTEFLDMFDGLTEE